MPRQLRIEYPGAIYHLMNRGDRREPVFRDDQDHELFLTTLGEACQKTGWQVHAFCLMNNHFHLVVETPRANLVMGMRWFLSTYTARFNRRHKLFGHLFSGRYKSLIVDGSGNGYLKTVCDYVHLNPVRAKLLRREQPLKAYRWSSWLECLKPPRKRHPWMRVDRLMGEWGIRQDSAAGRRLWEATFEQHRELDQAREKGDWQRLRRGWCLGSKAFKTEMLDLIGERQDQRDPGAEMMESEEQKAERLIHRRLRERGWTEYELPQRRKTDKVKVDLAKVLRRETTMTWEWIAQRLAMGHWRTAANAVRAASEK
jgi:putative transposase